MKHLHVVQISDSHLFESNDATLLSWPTAASFQQIMVSVAAEHPDLLLFTGDVSQDGSRASYETAASLVAELDVPCLWVPGNHDHLDAMAATFDREMFHRGPVFEHGGWRFVLLDSHVPGAVHGELTDETLGFLREELATTPQLPTCTVLHHPPVATGTKWLDPLGLHHPQSFLRIMTEHDVARLAVFGHIHQAFEQTYGGTHLLACPSTCIQFKPRSDEFALDTLLPGYRSLRLYPDGRFSSEVKRVHVEHEVASGASGY
jgi:3',5'-cyclic-AMP phosphodiesterase